MQQFFLGLIYSSSWGSSPSNLPFERWKHLLSISILVATLCPCFPHLGRLEEHWFWEMLFQGHDPRIGNSGIWLVLSPHLSLHSCDPGMGPSFPSEDNSHQGRRRIKAGTDSCSLGCTDWQGRARPSRWQKEMEKMPWRCPFPLLPLSHEILFLF